jgi:hypothetical protein
MPLEPHHRFRVDTRPARERESRPVGWMTEEEILALLSRSLASVSGLPEHTIYARLSLPLHTVCNRLQSVSRFKKGHLMRASGDRRDSFSPEFITSAVQVIVVNVEEYFTLKKNAIRGNLEAVAASKQAWRAAIEHALSGSSEPDVQAE